MSPIIKNGNYASNLYKIIFRHVMIKIKFKKWTINKDYNENVKKNRVKYLRIMMQANNSK